MTTRHSSSARDTHPLHTSTQGAAKTAQQLAVPDSFHCCVLVLHLSEQVQEKESFTFTPQ
jgi:hypothetical protein